MWHVDNKCIQNIFDQSFGSVRPFDRNYQTLGIFDRILQPWFLAPSYPQYSCFFCTAQLKRRAPPGRLCLWRPCHTRAAAGATAGATAASPKPILSTAAIPPPPPDPPFPRQWVPPVAAGPTPAAAAARRLGSRHCRAAAAAASGHRGSRGGAALQGPVRKGGVGGGEWLGGGRGGHLGGEGGSARCTLARWEAAPLPHAERRLAGGARSSFS